MWFFFLLLLLESMYKLISPVAFSDYFSQEHLDKLAQENKQINILEAQIEVSSLSTLIKFSFLMP